MAALKRKRDLQMVNALPGGGKGPKAKATMEAEKSKLAAN